MKKVLAIALSALLSFSVLNSAKAVDIAEGMVGVWGATLHSNGKTTVASYTGFGNDIENYVSFNFNGKNSGWSQGVLIEGASAAKATVLDNGTVVIIYLEGETFKYTTTKDGEDFTTPGELPFMDSFGFDWTFDLANAKNRVVLTAIAQTENAKVAYTWTSDKTLQTWTRETVGEIYPSNVFADCQSEPGQCNYWIQGLLTTANASGQLAMVVMVSFQDGNSNNAPEKYATLVSQRKSLTSEWSAFKSIDSFGPADVNINNYIPKGLVVTPKGKTVVAMDKVFGIGDEATPSVNTVKVFQSDKFGKSFVSKDAGVLSSGYGNGNSFIVNQGEKVYMLFQKDFDDSYEGSQIYIGEVGKMSKAKHPASLKGFDANGLVIKNGNPVAVIEDESDSSSSLYSVTANGAKVGKPHKFMQASGSKRLFTYTVSCFSKTKRALCASGINLEPDDMQLDLLGLEVTFVK